MAHGTAIGGTTPSCERGYREHRKAVYAVCGQYQSLTLARAACRTGVAPGQKAKQY